MDQQEVSLNLYLTVQDVWAMDPDLRMELANLYLLEWIALRQVYLVRPRPQALFPGVSFSNELLCFRRYQEMGGGAAMTIWGTKLAVVGLSADGSSDCETEIRCRLCDDLLVRVFGLQTQVVERLCYQCSPDGLGIVLGESTDADTDTPTIVQAGGAGRDPERGSSPEG